MTILDEHTSDEGIQALALNYPQNEERHLAMAEVLRSSIDALALTDQPHIPVMMSGMASSTLGWQSLPYAPLPAPLDGSTLRYLDFEVDGHPVRLISGLHSANDVMRGEETELVGLFSGPAKARATDDFIVILPGTHSKWVRVKDATVTGFRTFLTGEMFSLLCEHSILRHSVGSSRQADGQSPVFRERLRTVLENPSALPFSLFSIRAEGLLGEFPPDDAAAALSGYLIGAEIAGARSQFATAGNEVILIASGGLADLYSAALEEAGMTTTVIDAETAVRTALFEAARFKLRGS